MFRRFCRFLFAAAACLPAAASYHLSGNDRVFGQLESIVKSLSEISGLTENHAVSYGRMNKVQLRRFLARRVKRTLRPEEIRADELALKMFGLVPADFDLKKSTVNLLTEQAAAFYDYDQKKLFLLDDSSFEEELTTLSHELSHALVDQHFDLGKFMDETSDNDDENLARTAVVEGQASWLMMAYELKKAGQPAVPTPAMIRSVVDSSEGSIAEYPVLKSSPLYIQQSLLFPYTEGTRFFDTVYKKQGKAAFAGVFTDAPADSSQILHPDRYFAHIQATKPQLPKLEAGGDQTELSEGSVGEFDHEILLWQYLGESKAKLIASHLRGGQFKIVGLGKGHTPILTYVSEWDSAAEAAVFFAAYKSVLRSKWKRCDVSLNSGDVFAGEGDDGYFVTKLAGDRVSSIEGLKNVAQWSRLKSAKDADARRQTGKEPQSPLGGALDSAAVLHGCLKSGERIVTASSSLVPKARLAFSNPKMSRKESKAGVADSVPVSRKDARNSASIVWTGRR